MSITGIRYVASEWPHGLRCGNCSYLFVEGDTFSTQLYAFMDEIPMTEVVCTNCAANPSTTKDGEA